MKSFCISSQADHLSPMSSHKTWFESVHNRALLFSHLFLDSSFFMHVTYIVLLQIQKCNSRGKQCSYCGIVLGQTLRASLPVCFVNSQQLRCKKKAIKQAEPPRSDECGRNDHAVDIQGWSQHHSSCVTESI